jgi:hypothetical protein
MEKIMTVYELYADALRAVPETSFEDQKMLERQHIQQLLRKNIEALGDDLMVIAEEFSDWVDSSRRIDLLCLDREANLVVIEIKRTEDGGHMELQALRYAAMVSKMTFDQLVAVLARSRSSDNDAARAEILGFLDWREPDEKEFGRDTRIILASANFSKELTTAVIWLRDRDIDIRCVRLKPHKLENGPLLLDIQQIIPLPEAEEFLTQIGVKRQQERLERTERHEGLLAFWSELLAYANSRTQIHANRQPSTDHWLSGSIGRSGFSLSYVVRKKDCQVELSIALGSGQSEKNFAAFRALEAQRHEIDAEFGQQLDWMDLPNRQSCKIRYVMAGGVNSPREEWPRLIEQMTDAMIRLDKVMRTRVAMIGIYCACLIVCAM